MSRAPRSPPSIGGPAFLFPDLVEGAFSELRAEGVLRSLVCYPGWCIAETRTEHSGMGIASFVLSFFSGVLFLVLFLIFAFLPEPERGRAYPPALELTQSGALLTLGSTLGPVGKAAACHGVVSLESNYSTILALIAISERRVPFSYCYANLQQELTGPFRPTGDCHVTVKEFQSNSETIFALRALPANCGVSVARSAGLEPATS